MRKEPGIEAALNPLGVEMKRIETIGGETYAIVFEAMTGLPKLDLKRHFEELTRILRTISSQDDLRKASDELKKWGLPVFKLMDADFETFADEIKAQPAAGAAQQMYLQELRRIQKLGPEFVESLVIAMGTREISDRMNRKLREAAAKGLLARCKSEALMIEVSIRGFLLNQDR
jgi:hypothetical protein